MKTILEKLIRISNPQFTAGPSISGNALWSHITSQLVNRIRARRMLIYGMNPQGLSLGKQVKFFSPRDIAFGKNVIISDYSYIHAMGKGSLVFGDNSGVGAFCRIVSYVMFNDIPGHIKLGNNTWIGDGANLGGGGGLDIGDNTFTGQYFTVHPENHRFDDPNTLFRLQGVTRKGIKIGSNCWIGAKVTIIDGVTIGNNCVIAAGSVITKSVPSNSLMGGVPARLIREIECNL